MKSKEYLIFVKPKWNSTLVSAESSGASYMGLWALYNTYISLPDAVSVAGKLAALHGAENVRICKNVEFGVEYNLR